MSSLVQEYANARFEQVMFFLEGAKGYVRFMTFEDDDQVYGEHFGQGIAEALYAGQLVGSRTSPRVRLRSRGCTPYVSVERIKPKAVDDHFIAVAVAKFDPRARGPGVLEKLGL